MSDKNSIIHNKSHLLEMLIESTKTAYVILDTEGKVLETNIHFINMLGFKNDSILIGQLAKLFISSDDHKKYEDSMNDLLNGKNVDNIEYCLENNITFKPKASWIRVSAGLMENGTKRIFCIVTDITKAKNDEMKKYIEDQKKKDKIRQTIISIREPLRKELQSSK